MDSRIRIDMDSLWELGRDLTEVRSALRYYQKKQAILTFDEEEIEPIFLQQFLEHVLSLQKEKLKKCQRKGINLALKRKYEGKGTYGRPKTILPEDFDERIEECLILIAKDYMMTSFLCNIGCFHTSRSATNNKNFFLCVR